MSQKNALPGILAKNRHPRTGLVATMSDDEGAMSCEKQDIEEIPTVVSAEGLNVGRQSPGQQEDEEDVTVNGDVMIGYDQSIASDVKKNQSSFIWVYPVAVVLGGGLVWKGVKRLLERKNSKHSKDSLICKTNLHIDQPSVPESVILSKDCANMNGFPRAYTFVVSERIHVCGCGDCSVSAPVVDILIQRGSVCVGVVPYSLDIEWIRRYLKQTRASAWHGLGDVGVGVAVSKGICEFAIGVDEVGTTMSSIISSGVFGYRPTSGLVIAEGLIHSSPTLSTVCIAARDGGVLQQCSRALNIPKSHFQDTVERYLVAEDLFTICGEDVKGMLPAVIEAVKRWAGPDQAQSLSFCQWMYHRIPSIKDFMKKESMDATVPSTKEILDTLASAAITIWHKEKRGDHPFAQDFKLGAYSEAIKVAEDVSTACRNAMEEGLVFVIPACSCAVPDLKSSAEALAAWERDCMRFACISSLAGIPSVVIPVRGKEKGVQRNLAVSILARHRKDYTLLRSAGKICSFIAEGKKLPSKSPKSTESLKSQDTSLGEKEKNLGNKCFMAKKYDQAVQHYSNALQLDPQNPIYLSNRAMSYLKLGAYQEAEEDCTRALELDSCLVKALLRRGAARVALAQFQAAKSDFERVLVLEPQNKQAREELKNVIALS